MMQVADTDCVMARAHTEYLKYVWAPQPVQLASMQHNTRVHGSMSLSGWSGPHLKADHSLTNPCTGAFAPYIVFHTPSVTLIEAKELLGSFDLRLREYAARKLTSRGVQLLKVGRGCSMLPRSAKFW